MLYLGTQSSSLAVLIATVTLYTCELAALMYACMCACMCVCVRLPLSTETLDLINSTYGADASVVIQ